MGMIPASLLKSNRATFCTKKKTCKHESGVTNSKIIHSLLHFLRFSTFLSLKVYPRCAFLSPVNCHQKLRTSLFISEYLYWGLLFYFPIDQTNSQMYRNL